MQITEALNALDKGHTIWMVGYAKRVCKALAIPFDNELIETWHSGGGLFIREEGSLGVDGLSLSQYVAEQFKVSQKAKSFIGQGSQSREYARLVRDELQRQGKI